jgi:hypothetical protein
MDYGQASLGITTLSLIWSDILQSSLFYTDMDGNWDMDYGQASLGINYSIMDMNNKIDDLSTDVWTVQEKYREFACLSLSLQLIQELFGSCIARFVCINMSKLRLMVI